MQDNQLKLKRYTLVLKDNDEDIYSYKGTLEEIDTFTKSYIAEEHLISAISKTLPVNVKLSNPKLEIRYLNNSKNTDNEIVINKHGFFTMNERTLNNETSLIKALGYDPKFYDLINKEIIDTFPSENLKENIYQLSYILKAKYKTTNVLYKSDEDYNIKDAYGLKKLVIKNRNNSEFLKRFLEYYKSRYDEIGNTSNELIDKLEKGYNNFAILDHLLNLIFMSRYSYKECREAYLLLKKHDYDIQKNVLTKSKTLCFMKKNNPDSIKGRAIPFNELENINKRTTPISNVINSIIAPAEEDERLEYLLQIGNPDLIFEDYTMEDVNNYLGAQNCTYIIEDGEVKVKSLSKRFNH